MLALFRNLFSPPRHMILLLAAAWIGLSLAEKRTERHGVGKDDLNNITFYGLIAFVVGGRVSFVLQNITAFVKSPFGILSINPDLFDLLGAGMAVIIFTIVYCQRHNLPLWSVLDALTPFLASLMVGLGLSHLAAGTAFGITTNLPWGINLWNAFRHPTQIYETLASFLIFGLLWLKRQDPHPGMLFLNFAALTAASQIFIHAFRGDSTLIFYGLRQEQLMAWVVLAGSFIMMENRLHKPEKV